MLETNTCLTIENLKNKIFRKEQKLSVIFLKMLN